MDHRENCERAIEDLARVYPQTFFAHPAHRLPLKSGIADDVQRDGFPLPAGEIPAVIAWYQSNFGYQYSIQAGAKRIDLHGKPVAVVTPAEQQNAERYIANRKAEMERKKALNTQAAELSTPVQTMNGMHAQGHADDNLWRKVDAPDAPQPWVDPPEYVQPDPPRPEPQFQPAPPQPRVLHDMRQAEPPRPAPRPTPASRRYGRDGEKRQSKLQTLGDRREPRHLASRRQSRNLVHDDHGGCGHTRFRIDTPRHRQRPAHPAQ
jgi:sRNA-binding protein